MSTIPKPIGWINLPGQLPDQRIVGYIFRDNWPSIDYIKDLWENRNPGITTDEELNRVEEAVAKAIRNFKGPMSMVTFNRIIAEAAIRALRQT